jgi:hypothetical protein
MSILRFGKKEREVMYKDFAEQLSKLNTDLLRSGCRNHALMEALRDLLDALDGQSPVMLRTAAAQARAVLREADYAATKV